MIVSAFVLRNRILEAARQLTRDKQAITVDHLWNILRGARETCGFFEFLTVLVSLELEILEGTFDKNRCVPPRSIRFLFVHSEQEGADFIRQLDQRCDRDSTDYLLYLDHIEHSKKRFIFILFRDNGTKDSYTLWRSLHAGFESPHHDCALTLSALSHCAR